jgi:hypothetical protein
VASADIAELLLIAGRSEGEILPLADFLVSTFARGRTGKRFED